MEGALKWRGGKSGQRYFHQREGRAGVVVVSLTRRAKSEEHSRGQNDLFLTKVLDKPDLRSEVKSESKSKSRSKCRDHNDYLGSLYLS